jgi:hypothetical protein
MMIRSPLTALCVLVLCWPALGRAQTVYKSVDAQGNVTYSNAPVPAAVGVEPVTVQIDAKGQGSPDRQRVPQEPQRQNAETQKTRAEHKERTGQQAAAIAEAERRLKAARQGLEAAKQQWDEDRRSPDRDSRVDNQAYGERVKEARREVIEAERVLQDAKAGVALPESEATPEAPAQAKR